MLQFIGIYAIIFPEIMISCSVRILDANFNRASEGLRSLEDIVLCVLNSYTISHQLKTICHDLREKSKLLGLKLLSQRNSQHTDKGNREQAGSQHFLMTVKSQLQFDS